MSEAEALARGILKQPLHVLQAKQSGSAKARRSGKGSPAQTRLWQVLQGLYGDAVAWEYTQAVPGRKFRIDIAFPAQRLAIEIDGWQYHAKTLEGFKEHTRRQNLLVSNGWRLLRYLPSDVNERLDEICEEISGSLRPMARLAGGSA
ncbi:DUF559 domain-containing protein [Sinimarinibacterium sp. CAU 1509]|uniref:endonuclease domain-containing protein n=1 Tax=Sinimarinibacterium sp. CAU 1509 TaxID=2562283 RepID=UPI0010AB9AF3|nr:DUF559 domain-containing protein [Sinimarinibacterium sp. CAU 1509]TJY57254.1 DUF559 domain-containing protein [Sinimarinibacterium sp. CAU 1509]